MRWFHSGTKYGKSLTITGNNAESGCKTAGKIGEISGKIVDKSEFITAGATGVSTSYLYK